jgi:hypothetical protein
MNLNFLKRLPFGAEIDTHKIILNGSGPERVMAEQVLEYMLDGLPELLAAAVVQVSSGRALATYTSASEFNPNKVLGFNAEVVRQTHGLLQAISMEDEQIEDILITLRNQLHLLRLLPNGEQMLYLVVDCRDTNLALARTMMQTCMEIIPVPVI